MLSLARSAPEGRLDDFQRSKVRVWADYRAELGRFGSFTVAPIYRYNSARTYSLVLNGQPLSAVQAARNPGYAGTPTQQVFFGERGSQSFEGFALRRPRGDLRRSRVALGAAVDQVRDVQRAEQPEAHRVGHDDHRRRGQRARRVRPADGLRAGRRASARARRTRTIRRRAPASTADGCSTSRSDSGSSAGIRLRTLESRI